MRASRLMQIIFTPLVAAMSAVAMFTPNNCSDFNVGRYMHEFCSPNYPDHYYPLLNCVRKLYAPVGYIITIDFLGPTFHVEAQHKQGACLYDFLEIRDGPFGFSPLIGKFCGTKHPPIINTTSNIAWIRFRSDNLVQYSGFRATYKFIKTTDEIGKKETLFNCSYQVDANDGEIALAPLLIKAFKERSQNELDCVWKLRASSEFFLRFDLLNYTMALPNDCSQNSVEIYRTYTTEDNLEARFCGSSAKMTEVHSNIAFVHLHYQKKASKAALTLRYSAYFPTTATSTQCTNDLYFSCGDSTCISKSLVCNGRPNCVHGKDEDECGGEGKKPTFNTGPYLSILVVIGAGITVIISCAIVVNVYAHRQANALSLNCSADATGQDDGPAESPVITANHTSSMPSNHKIPPICPLAATAQQQQHDAVRSGDSKLLLASYDRQFAGLNSVHHVPSPAPDILLNAAVSPNIAREPATKSTGSTLTSVNSSSCSCREATPERENYAMKDDPQSTLSDCSNASSFGNERSDETKSDDLYFTVHI